jgi:conjugative transposon TraN protein
MKQIVCGICGVLMLSYAIGQTTNLGISTDKTTTLVFPFAILHVDRGTKNILVQPVKEAENILLVKAATKDFNETNLSVVTGDGTVYCFILRYEGHPDTSVFHLPAQSSASIATYANAILVNQGTTRRPRLTKWDIHLRLTGIYIKGDVLYYQLRMANDSPIDYGVDFIRFYLKDRKKGKRTSLQENELKPLYLAGNSSRIVANNASVIVVALEKFTLPHSKYLAIEINEQNGGRHLSMKVGNRDIMRASTLPDLK